MKKTAFTMTGIVIAALTVAVIESLGPEQSLQAEVSSTGNIYTGDLFEAQCEICQEWVTIIPPLSTFHDCQPLQAEASEPNDIIILDSKVDVFRPYPNVINLETEASEPNKIITLSPIELARTEGAREFEANNERDKLLYTLKDDWKITYISPTLIRELAESGRICEVLGHQWGDQFIPSNLNMAIGYRCRLCYPNARGKDIEWLPNMLFCTDEEDFEMGLRLDGVLVWRIYKETQKW